MSKKKHSSASLVIPIGDPWDGFFYPTLTLRIDTIILAHQIGNSTVLPICENSIPHTQYLPVGKTKKKNDST